MRRLLLALAVLAGSLMMTSGASAKGSLLKGQIIPNSEPIQTTTGSCSCVWPWYTFGLNPGEVTVTATMRTYSHIISGSWGIRLFLYRGNTVVGHSQIGCWASQKTCVRSAVVKSNVKRKGVYYARVEGPGADGIAFSLRVDGNFYAMRCGTYCQ